MIRTVIIDDEKNSASALQTLIEMYCKELEVIKIFNDSRLALDFLLLDEVDLVFLDIQMPYISGIDLLKKIPNPSFSVIFTTAYDQYAIEAIKLSALDYILKPIDPEKLVSAVSRFQSKDSDSSSSSLEIDNASNPNSKLVVQLHDKTLFIDHEDILYLEAESNYTHIHLIDGVSHMTSKTIKYFEAQLKNSGFYRTHQSYLVNTKKVSEYIKADHSIVLKNKKMIPVSKNKKDGLMEALYAIRT